MTLWGAILTGIVVLSIVVIYLDYSQSIIPIEGSQESAQILFVLAVIVAIAILILKRSVFSPYKVVQRARQAGQGDAEQIIFTKLRRNYIMIWALAELICFLGFFNYVLIVDLYNYFIFTIVSIYSVIINMPRENLVIQCMDLLRE
jgi:hypothetical protein